MMLDDIDIANPDAYVGGVPHAQFALLRREAPVFRHREANGPGFWVLTRHEDIARVARDLATFSQAPSLFIEDLPAGDLRDSPDVMINMDPPRHTRFRALVSKGFTPRIIQRLEGRVREVVTELIDVFAARGTADFVRDLASELPMRIILDLMGVSREEQPAVLDFSMRFFGALDPKPPNGLAGVLSGLGVHDLVERGLHPRLQSPRELVEDVSELVEPVALLAGLRPHVADGRPEPEGTIAPPQRRAGACPDVSGRGASPSSSLRSRGSRPRP